MEAPNDTSYKRWSCTSGHKLLCKLCQTFPPPAMGAQYTDTWACHLHRESRLTQTDPIPLDPGPNPLATYTIHTTATKTQTDPTPLDPGPNPLATYTTATKTQTHVRHSPCSHRIGKVQIQSSYPLTALPPPSTHAISRQTHTHLTYSTNSSHPTLIHNTSAALDTIPEPRVPPTCPYCCCCLPTPMTLASGGSPMFPLVVNQAGGGLITLIRDNITFTTTDILSTINTHNTELQMVKVHINNTKHITIANIYIPPRNSTSTHYKTADIYIFFYSAWIKQLNNSHSAVGKRVGLRVSG